MQGDCYAARLGWSGREGPQALQAHDTIHPLVL